MNRRKNFKCFYSYSVKFQLKKSDLKTLYIYYYKISKARVLSICGAGKKKRCREEIKNRKTITCPLISYCTHLISCVKKKGKGNCKRMNSYNAIFLNKKIHFQNL